MRDPRFLIIDADPDNRRELGNLLGECAHVADQPDSASEAGKFLSNSSYDCVLVDRDIPSEWRSVMAANGHASGTAPLIFLTGPEGSAPTSAIAVSGADGYVPRARESVHQLARHIASAVKSLLTSSPASSPVADRGASHEKNRMSFRESIADSRITVRTSRIATGGPQEDIALVTDRSDGRYNMLLGDFTCPTEIRELELVRLKHRAQSFLEESLTPDRLLFELNTELIRSSPAVDFMTAVVLFMDLNRRPFSYSIAGHQPPLYRRWRSVKWQPLPGHGIPLGVRTGETFSYREKRVSPGDRILLLSDGFLKMRGSKGGFKDLESAVEGIDELPGDAAPIEILEGIDDLVKRVTGGQEVSDEITSMLIQV